MSSKQTGSQRLPPEMWLAVIAAAIASYGTTTLSGSHGKHGATGGITISSVYTLLFALIVIARSPRVAALSNRLSRKVRAPKFLVFWMFWAIFSVAWGSLGKEAGQELCVVITFVGIIAATSSLAPKNAIRSFVRVLTPISWVLSVIFLFLIATKGLSEAKTIGATRGFAIEACLLTASAVVGCRLLKIRWTRPLTVLVPMTIVLSLSRTAIVAVIVVLTIGFAMTSPKKPRLGNVFVALVAGLGLVAGLVELFPALKDRFSGGDDGHLLGFSINTEGRARAWSLLWDSATHTWTHFVIGQGIGSATTFTTLNVGPAFPQPHNDYLRLLFDGGIIGFSLFMIGSLTILVRSYRGARRRDLTVEGTAAHVATFLCLMVLFIMMSTDNPIVYPFFMYPLGCFIGLSLAASGAGARKDQDAIPAIEEAVDPRVPRGRSRPPSYNLNS
jgi:O-antigen ligase